MKPIQTEPLNEMKIDFNINEYVLVKLTEEGKRLLERDHHDFWKNVGKEQPYLEPKEDSHGYSKWQLWDLMQRLGKYCQLCSNHPFETDIIFIKKN